MYLTSPNFNSPSEQLKVVKSDVLFSPDVYAAFLGLPRRLNTNDSFFFLSSSPLLNIKKEYFKSHVYFIQAQLPFVV